MSNEWKWIATGILLAEFSALAFILFATILSGIASDPNSKVTSAKLLSNSVPFGLIAGGMGLLVAFVAQRRGEGWWSVVAGILGVLLILWSLCIPLVGLSNIRAKSLQDTTMNHHSPNNA